MELLLLGTVELRSGRTVRDLGPPQRRAVLAALAVDVGQPVPLATLLDRVWDKDPPAAARSTLYAHLTRLRRSLADAAAPTTAAPTISRRASGYLLEIDPELIDLHRFRRLAGEGAPVGRLAQALNLWRGNPLADVPGRWADGVRHGLDQELIGVAQAWARAELAVGRVEPVIRRLTDLIGRYPLAEPLVALLMRALCAAGRPAEALERYAATRGHLAEELGTEPGAGLHDVYRAVLRGELDQHAAIPGRPRAALAAPPVVPAQLPPSVADFTGRDREIERMDSLLRTAGEMPILTIAGAPGVGKTALALHWAHRAATRYPDGQLYVNLRGYDPDLPVEPDEALGQFLRALGVGPADIPPETPARSALLRTLLAGRRVLVLLDNAASEEQVRPLLPGAASCAIVVTSRGSLAGLVARDGARRLNLGALPIEEAVVLLGKLIGDRARRHPAATAMLAEHCARLPLALRVAAELATVRPAIEVAALARELADDQRRLDLLDAAGDRRSAVSATLSWSYRHLPPSAARAFRLLGIHPGREYDGYALAALADLDLPSARRALTTLTRAHLLEEYQVDRYVMHDLLHAYARGLANETEREPTRRAAMSRLYDAYRRAAADAMDTLQPAERLRRPRVPPAGTPIPALDDQAAAAAWLDAEHRNLIAACVHAAHGGWSRHALDIVATVWRHLYVRGWYDDALALSNLVLPIARSAGDRSAEAQNLNQISSIWLRRGQPERAAALLTESLALLRGTGNRHGEGRVLGNLGIYHGRMGQYDRAVDYLRQSLRISEELGDRAATGHSLGNLAEVYRLQGHDEAALEHNRQALAIHREAGQPIGESISLSNIGAIYERLGQYTLAIDHLRQALSLDQETGNRSGEGIALNGLGTALRRMGRYAEAVEHHRRAVEVHEQTGNLGGQVESLNGLGEALWASGECDEAHACHESALALLGNGGEPRERARAYAGLAQARSARGDQEGAGELWRLALAIYTDIGAPEAGDIRDRLSLSRRPAR